MYNFNIAYIKHQFSGAYILKIFGTFLNMLDNERNINLNIYYCFLMPVTIDQNMSRKNNNADFALKLHLMPGAKTWKRFVDHHEIPFVDNEISLVII